MQSDCKRRQLSITICGPTTPYGAATITALRAELVSTPRYSRPLGLWCPYCRQPFVGTVDRMTGRFAHGSCPVGELDAEQLDNLAGESWFWTRFRERLYDVD